MPLWWWLSGDNRETALCSTEICTWLTLDAQPLLAFLISLMDIFYRDVILDGVRDRLVYA